MQRTKKKWNWTGLEEQCWQFYELKRIKNFLTDWEVATDGNSEGELWKRDQRNWKRNKECILIRLEA